MVFIFMIIKDVFQQAITIIWTHIYYSYLFIYLYFYSLNAQLYQPCPHVHSLPETAHTHFSYNSKPVFLRLWSVEVHHMICMQFQSKAQLNHFYHIIVKTVLFEPYPSLEDSVRLHPVFTSLDFAIIIFYTARSSALRPTSNLEDQVPVFMFPSDRVAQLYPQAPGSLFVALYYSQGYGEGITELPYTGGHNYRDLVLYVGGWTQG
jgi:hypothetical protein